MAKNIYFEAKGQPRKQNILEMSPENLLYVRGEPADYFIMILEGRARIIVTSENQEYDAGPFCVFGVKALTKPSTGAPAGVVGSFDTKSEDRPVAQSEEGKKLSKQSLRQSLLKLLFLFLFSYCRK